MNRQRDLGADNECEESDKNKINKISV